MEIGKKITKLRKERCLTQKDLADALHISDKAISRWESGNGNPDIEIIPDIAKFFGVTTDYLLGADEVMHYRSQPPAKDRSKLYATLLSLGVAACILTFIICLSIFISSFVIYDQGIAEASKFAVVGISFPTSELANKTIEFAKGQDVIIDKDSATFVQWQDALLTKYTLRGDAYWVNQAPIWDNNIYFLLIPIIASCGACLPCIIYQLKYIKKIKKDGKSNSKEAR